MAYNAREPVRALERTADPVASRGASADRYRERNKLLRAHGYTRYSDYISGGHWRQLRAAYRASELPQACFCGEIDVQLHHLTYERICAELLSDLTPLCARCHQLVHVLEWRGEIGIDLEGLTDAERAAQGREWLAQEAKRLEAEAIERAQGERQEVLGMSFAGRLMRARRVCRMRHINLSHQFHILAQMHKNGASDEQLTRRLRVIESQAYGWDDWF